MKDNNFKQGDEVFLSNGEIGEFIAATEDGYVVFPTMLDEGEEIYRGDPVVVHSVFGRPPRAQHETKIKDLNTEIQSLVERRGKLQSDIRFHEAAHEERMKKLGTIKALENLEQFIDGKITHFVIDHYGYSIVAVGDAKCESSDHDTKLLTLFGRSDGNLAWRLSHYYDGSGGYYSTYPCLSHEEAVAKLVELAEKEFKEFRAENSSDYRVERVIASLNKLGLSAKVPSDIKAALDESNITKAKKELAGLDEKRKKILEQINE